MNTTPRRVLTGHSQVRDLACSSLRPEASSAARGISVAVLFCDPKGNYAGLEGVELWDEKRDARLYAGPHPVVAHPPCARWCRMAYLVEVKGGKKRGEDDGCFASALASVRKWGGVLEHPAYSDAWVTFGLTEPVRGGGWHRGVCGGWVCHVEQSRYGHLANKPTWLYAVGATNLPRMRWGTGGKGTGVIAFAKFRDGRKEITRKQRSATPAEFRDALLAIARSARGTERR